MVKARKACSGVMVLGIKSLTEGQAVYREGEEIFMNVDKEGCRETVKLEVRIKELGVGAKRLVDTYEGRNKLLDMIIRGQGERVRDMNVMYGNEEKEFGRKAVQGKQ
jgi:hypothetical protein